MWQLKGHSLDRKPEFAFPWVFFQRRVAYCSQLTEATRLFSLLLLSSIVRLLFCFFSFFILTSRELILLLLTSQWFVAPAKSELGGSTAPVRFWADSDRTAGYERVSSEVLWELAVGSLRASEPPCHPVPKGCCEPLVCFVVTFPLI